MYKENKQEWLEHYFINFFINFFIFIFFIFYFLLDSSTYKSHYPCIVQNFLTLSTHFSNNTIISLTTIILI